ncbi:MAG: carboxypeptidase regulatory-like domain-containing protein [Acidobacteriota bacterium]|nr:carboxypeptidase regulatory-like domain-containing protein [Acidobacteriota bacterium]
MKNNTNLNYFRPRKFIFFVFIALTILFFIFDANAQNPAPDSTFNGNGRRITDMGAASESAYAVIAQPDGKIVAVGASNVTMALVRYDTNGQLDTSFDGDGIVTFSTGVVATAAALQPDGKILVGGSYGTNIFNVREIAVTRFNSNGTIDPTFDGDGIARSGLQFTDPVVSGLILQPDGKIVVSGYVRNGGGLDYNITLTRYNSDGSLDTTFDGDGRVITDINNAAAVDVNNGIAIQPDGKFVVAGGYNTGSTFRDTLLVRYNPNGSLDTSFDGDGLLFYDFAPGNNDEATSVAVHDGKIIIGATAPDSFDTYLALARFNSDGTFDTTFDGDGIRVTTYQTSAKQILLQPQGNILVLGGAVNGGYSLFRFKPDGSNETTFGTLGSRQGIRYGTITSASAMTTQPGSKIVVVGRDLANSNNNFFAARFTALEPTAASVSVGGKVLSSTGRAIFGATVYLTDREGNTRQTTTNSFGYYRFHDISVGETYVLNVFSKRYAFVPQLMTITDETFNLNFIAENPAGVKNYEK